jgi:hypothetical protein
MRRIAGAMLALLSTPDRENFLRIAAPIAQPKQDRNL